VSEGTGEATQGAQENGAEAGGAKTFTQDEVNQLVGQARTEERRKIASKFADYDDLKTKAEGAKTLEERLAEVEQRAAKAEIDALRSRYAADVPEKLRPLLTATTDEELKAQRALILEGESDRKKIGNVAPTEGGNPNPSDVSGDERAFVRGLFGRAD